MTTLDSYTRLLAFTAQSIAPDEGELAALAVLARCIERGHRGPANHRQGQQTGTDPAVPRTARTIDPGVGERREGG
jgi:hypothetical protein